MLSGIMTKKKSPEPWHSHLPILRLSMIQYFGHLMRRTSSLEMTLMLLKIEGKRRRKQQRMGRLDSITDSMDMNLSKLWETVEDRGVRGTPVHGGAKCWTWHCDWTATWLQVPLQVNSDWLLKRENPNTSEMKKSLHFVQWKWQNT